jgi:hypothetical protein
VAFRVADVLFAPAPIQQHAPDFGRLHSSSRFSLISRIQKSGTPMASR